MIVSLPYVPANNTICTFSPNGIVILQASVTVVSTSDVVKLASVTVLVASASKRVPLGSPALSVSILTQRLTDGLTYFLNASFNVLLATPLQKAGILTLVLAATLPIRFCNTSVVDIEDMLFQSVSFDHQTLQVLYITLVLFIGNQGALAALQV